MCTPVFAEELLRKGARWRECSPLHVAHGNSEHVAAAAPASRQVCANILLVHKGRIFEETDVWLHVYEGSLPDVMLSETFLNTARCTSHPGAKLLDTREAAGDRELLLQSMEDYKSLVVRRFTHPECVTSCLHFAHLYIGSPDAVSNLCTKAKNKCRTKNWYYIFLGVKASALHPNWIHTCIQIGYNRENSNQNFAM
jgi:hypothetical protein